MKWLNCEKMKLALVVFVAAIVLGGGSARADFTFGEPVNLGPPINSSASDGSLCISADGLELFFDSERSGSYGASDLWVTTRQSKNDDWGSPVNLGSGINTSAYDWSPSLSADDLSLYFISGGHDGYGSNDVLVITRASRAEPWGEPVNLGPLINTSANDGTATISSDGLELYYYSDRPGKHGVRDIWGAKRTTVSGPWGEPVNLGPIVNRSNYNICPSISFDGLRLFYSSGSGSGNMELWMAKRVSKDASWEESINLGLDYGGTSPYISRDGLTLYFCDYAADQRPPDGLGGDDLWQVSIIPIVDFNGDGFIDNGDLDILNSYRDTNEPLCDIGPMPWGDGIVNEADVEVLMSYWGQDIGLVAHWKLDETEGTVIYDGISNIKAQLYGDPVWQPTDGMIDGALLLDGIDDFVGTWDIPGLSEGEFSLFVWVKGGAPGQVVVSGYQGVNWLMADASNGYLKTDVTATTGRSAGQSLVSEITITDGQWHHVGIAWDGLNRVIYVDSVAVASDMQSSPERSGMGLNIGCGPNETSGTFWSGVIDDVRIYNRAITP